jgi:hypothetical protein
MICIFVGSISWGAYADVRGWSVTVAPSTPVSLEPVFAKISHFQTCFLDPQQTTIQQDGGTIVVTVRGMGGGCIPIGMESTQDISLGQLQAGSFSVVVRATDGTQLTSAQFRVTESQPNRSNPIPLVNYSDLWWNSQESGWGINIAQRPSGRVFAAWYTYDEAGNTLWFTLQPGRWTSVTTYTGPIYRTTGPSYAGPFDPSRVRVTQVGTGTFTFDGPASGTFSYTVGSVSSTRRIERLMF